MKLTVQPQKFVNQLDADDMRKIFPENYYTKFAPHLKILQFEKSIIKKERGKRKLNLTTHKPPQKKAGTQSEKKIKLNRFDEFQDTIDKNKQQIERLNQYKSNLTRKMELGPTRKEGFIRIQRENIDQPKEDLLETMNAIENWDYEQELSRREMNKKPEEKVRFVRKQTRSMTKMPVYKPSRILPSKSSVLKLQSPRNDMQQIRSQLQDIIRKSQDINDSLNPQLLKDDQRSYIMNLNTAMKMSLKLIKKAGLDDTSARLSKVVRSQKKPDQASDPYGRRDLSLQTEKVRKYVASVAVQKSYEQLIRSRSIRSFLDRV